MLFTMVASPYMSILSYMRIVIDYPTIVMYIYARWQHYFLNVLNALGNFQEDVVNSVLLLSVRGHLDDVLNYGKI